MPLVAALRRSTILDSAPPQKRITTCFTRLSTLWLFLDRTRQRWQPRNNSLRGALSPELQRALEPLLAGIELLSERIRECNERIEKLAQQRYPHFRELNLARRHP